MGVAELTKIPKSAEGKFVFDSEIAYNKAVEQRVSSKVVDSKELQALLNPENVVFNKADAGAEPVVVVPAVEPKTASSTLVERLRKKAEAEGVEVQYENDDEIVEAVISKQKRINSLVKEIEMAEKVPVKEQDYEEIVRLRTELEQAKKGPAKAIVQIGDSKRQQIEFLRKQIAESTDRYGEGTVKLRDELSELLVYEQDRLEKLIQVNPQNNDVVATLGKLQKDFDELKNKNTEDERAVITDRKQKAEQEAISSFIKDHKEMAPVKPLEVLDKEYVQWGKQLFKLAFKRPTENLGEIKFAVERFDSDPDFQKEVKKAGIEKPVDIEKYLDICELVSIRDNLNEAMGKNHTLEQAMVYKMGLDGSINDAMTVQRKIGIDAAKKAQTDRDMNFAVQLNASAGASPEQAGAEISNEQALQILNSVSVLQAKKDPAKQALLEKAYKKLGVVRV